MRILIINITRMGDLLQTSPLIHGLRSKYPSAEITLLAQEPFRSVCVGIPGVDRLLTIQAEEWVERSEDNKSSLEDKYSFLRKHIARMGTDYDIVINLSHTSLSGALAKAVGGKEYRGMVSNAKGKSVVEHPWMSYFFFVTSYRAFNDINLVDMYNRTGETADGGKKLHYQIPPEAHLQANELLSDVEGDIIALQLGASAPARRWPPHLFAQTAELLQRKFDCNIALLGSSGEREYMEEFSMYYQNPFIDLVGKTTVPQLAAVLSRSRFLITNDTGTMHLACAVGTPVIAVFLAEARACDTGPYTEKALILEPHIDCFPCEYNSECKRNYECHSYISPENILYAVENFDHLTNGGIRAVPLSHLWEKSSLVRNIFESDGFIRAKNLVKRKPEFHEAVKLIYRQMWKQILSGKDYKPETSSELKSLLITGEFSSELDLLAELFARIRSLGEQGLNAVLEIIKFSQPENYNPARLNFHTQILTMLDSTLWNYEWNNRELIPLLRFSRQMVRNADPVERDEILQVSQEKFTFLIKAGGILLKEIESFA